MPQFRVPDDRKRNDDADDACDVHKTGDPGHRRSDVALFFKRAVDRRRIDAKRIRSAGIATTKKRGTSSCRRMRAQTTIITHADGPSVRERVTLPLRHIMNENELKFVSHSACRS